MSVPSGSSAEDERRETPQELAQRWRRESDEHDNRMASDILLLCALELESVLASRAPAGERQEAEASRLFGNEQSQLAQTSDERPYWKGWQDAAETIKNKAAPDGRANDELVEAAREVRAAWMAAPMTNAMFAPMKKLGDALSALAGDRRTP